MGFQGLIQPNGTEDPDIPGRIPDIIKDYALRFALKKPQKSSARMCLTLLHTISRSGARTRKIFVSGEATILMATCVSCLRICISPPGVPLKNN